MATDITFPLEAGAETAARQALRSAGVRIVGLTTVGELGAGEVHVCVRDHLKARQALEDAGLRVEQELEALITYKLPQITLEALESIARRFEGAGVEVLVYPSELDDGFIFTAANPVALTLIPV